MTATFWSRTREDGACVIWTGGTDRDGYGALRVGGKLHRAHRYAFFLRTGRWPVGLLRHLCNRPECVLHAVEGTRSENATDMVLAGRHNNARKTHCPRSHPYDEENTILKSSEGRRRCRTCRNASRRVPT